MIKSRKTLRVIALFLLVQFSTQVFLPSISYALTSGPSQPEFSSFEPVATTNMVDEFSGDFTYNLPIIEVPGPQGSSYPLSLSYHSGVTPEEESSWVGYGWTLNPGAINRNTRGLPDDFNGKDVTYFNRMPKNWTVSVGASSGIETISADLPGYSVNTAVRYNNYRGFGYSKGIGITLGSGVFSLGYQVSDREGSFSLSMDPMAPLGDLKEKAGKAAKKVKQKLDPKEKFKRSRDKFGFGTGFNLIGSSHGIFSYAESTKPNIIQQFTANSYNVSVGFQMNPAVIPLGFTMNINGSYTAQTNEPSETVPTYGYLYSAGAKESGNSVMDYHVEKETDYSKRDVFLGVPFNDADNFIVTGEGLSGGFRLHNKTSGHFGPRKIGNETQIYNVGAEIDAGPTWGLGLDLGKGKATLDVEDWAKGLSSFNSRTDPIDEPIFFRFSNDLGGEWGKNQKYDEAVQASISSENSFNVSSKDPVLSADNFNMNNGERSGRSSYIGYNTNAEMLSGGTPSYKAYNKRSDVNAHSDRASNADLIGEISVFNEAGNRYLYALPVYSKSEKDISYSLERSSIQEFAHNHIVYYNANSTLDNDAKIKVGQEQTAAYASSYLLTEITTPDYLDRGDAAQKADGPTEDDLGGYTRFNYVKHSDSYRWRAPYRGLIYTKNSHSDPKDDLGSYSEGEKEIYYVNSIETKTHVAIFTISDRADSKGAPIADALNKDSAPSTSLKQLDRIDIYVLSDCKWEDDTKKKRIVNDTSVKPIKTVRFVYDNSLSPNLPNAADSKGKLTLTKVYFEYNGIQRAKISAYEFGYAYPDFTAYPAKYQSGGADDVTKDVKPSANQNPAYNPLNTDAWGNYQSNGEYMHDNLMEWVDQRPQTDFDPAAWHLKVIKLPSGGQIHIQYEQDDYNFVQDQEAHVMATLDPVNSGKNNHFFINSSSIGIGAEGSPLSADERRLLRDIRKRINNRYKVQEKKMYFKLLYSLSSSNASLETCDAEFITGYSSISTCEIDSTATPGTVPGDYRMYVNFRESDRLPQEVCKDYVNANRLGMIYTSDCGGTAGLDVGDKPDDKDLAKNAVRAVFSSVIHTKIDINDLCREPNLNYSYLRIPTSLPKKGGGVRVKRLMMFDTGMESNPVLYGNEYLYQINHNNFTISSGVATNEPSAMREENILVDFIGRKGQEWWSKIIAGEDKKQSEGPLGESILPAPSVGYSRVIVRNIHSGKTSPGFSVTEFNTALNFPISLASPNNPNSMTSINEARPERELLPLGLVNIVTNKTWATQGFCFVLNSMHGQIKSTASYSGVYSKESDLKRSTETSRTDYTYFSPTASIPMMSSLTGGIVRKSPGREVDMTFAQRRVVESSNNVNIEVDLEFTTVFPFFMVWPTGMPSLNFIEGALHTHATTKVISYPAILKKVTTMQDNITHTEEYVAFDEWTGKPVATRSDDEFRSADSKERASNKSAGAYLTQQIPASWQYKTMTPKWTSEGLKLPKGAYTYSGDYVTLLVECFISLFSEGDKLEIGVDGALYHIVELDNVNNRLKVTPSSDAVATGVSTGPLVIFRTGKTNQLQQQAGSITQYAALRADAKVPTIPSINRYEDNTFATALKGLIGNLNGTGELPYLEGNYEHMDISGFADKLPGCNVTDLADVTIRHVKFGYVVEGTQVTLQLLAFDVDCDETSTSNTFTTVKAEGWE